MLAFCMFPLSGGLRLGIPFGILNSPDQLKATKTPGPGKYLAHEAPDVPKSSQGSPWGSPWRIRNKKSLKWEMVFFGTSVENDVDSLRSS